MLTFVNITLAIFHLNFILEIVAYYMIIKQFLFHNRLHINGFEQILTNGNLCIVGKHLLVRCCRKKSSAGIVAENCKRFVPATTFNFTSVTVF